MTRYFKKDASDPGNPDDLKNRIDPSSESYRVPEAEKANAFNIIDPSDSSHYGHMMRIINTDDYRLHTLEDKMNTIESGATADMTAAEILTELQGLPTPLALDVTYHGGYTVEEVLHNAVSAGFGLAHPTVWGSRQQEQWVGDNHWLIDGLTSRNVNRVRSAGFDRALICTRDYTPAKILVMDPWSNDITETIEIGTVDGLPTDYTCTDVVNMGEYLLAIFAHKNFHRFDLNSGGVPSASGYVGYMCKIYPTYLYDGVMSGLPVITDMTALSYDDPSTIIATQWKNGSDESSFIIGYCAGLGATDQAVIQKFKSDFSVSWTTTLTAGDSWITGIDTNGNKCVAVIGVRHFTSGPQADGFIYMIDPESGSIINWGTACYEVVSNAPNDTIFMDIIYTGDCFYVIDAATNTNQLYEYEFVNFANGAPPTYQQRMAIPRAGATENPFAIEYDGHRNLFVSYYVSGGPSGSIVKFKLYYDYTAVNYNIVTINALEALEGASAFAEYQYICNWRQGILGFGSWATGSAANIRNWGAQIRGQ